MAREIVPQNAVATNASSRQKDGEWESRCDFSDDPGINIPEHLLHPDKEYRWIRYAHDGFGTFLDLDNLRDAADHGFKPALLSEHPGIKDYHCYKFDKECILYGGLMLACRPKIKTYTPEELAQQKTEKLLLGEIVKLPGIKRMMDLPN